MVAAACPRCAGVIALHEGRPYVTSRGVELWHPQCWELRDEPEIEISIDGAPMEEVPETRSKRGKIGTVTGVALLVFASAQEWRVTPASALPNVVLSPSESVSARGSTTTREVTPAKPRSATALDEVYPSLREWIHPVSASSEHVPKLHDRRFGAERAGVERSECGGGHCGIDLDGPRGRPLVAVADGIVVHVDRSRNGGDGRSGRYVRIEHDDGAITTYMHMDAVADGLEKGQRLDAGQYIGTLGATAVFSAPPHLHFSLEVPRGRSSHRYVDPAPFLLRARIVPVPARRDAIKAF